MVERGIESVEWTSEVLMCHTVCLGVSLPSFDVLIHDMAYVHPFFSVLFTTRVCVKYQLQTKGGW